MDVIDSWAEIEISIVAHNLPIEKWNFDRHKCQFGNFPNVPTLAGMELKIKCDICVFYQ